MEFKILRIQEAQIIHPVIINLEQIPVQHIIQAELANQYDRSVRQKAQILLQGHDLQKAIQNRTIKYLLQVQVQRALAVIIAQAQVRLAARRLQEVTLQVVQPHQGAIPRAVLHLQAALLHTVQPHRGAVQVVQVIPEGEVHQEEVHQGGVHQGEVVEEVVVVLEVPLRAEAEDNIFVEYI